MKTERKRWRPSPPVVVLTTAIVLIVGLLLLGWINARRYRINALVEIADPTILTEMTTSPAALNIAGMPDGEVTRVATRVREATGLLMGLAVLALNVQIGNREPWDADNLVSLMSQRNLFPPGIKQASTKEALESDRAMIYVRYRHQPLGIEVISVGREKLDGPAVIARLVGGGDDNSSAVLLIAKKLEGAILPEPFVPLSKNSSLDWSIEPMRERPFTQQELDELNNWAKSYAAGNK